MRGVSPHVDAKRKAAPLVRCGNVRAVGPRRRQRKVYAVVRIGRCRRHLSAWALWSAGRLLYRRVRLWRSVPYVVNGIDGAAGEEKERSE